jgi:hypothetical protein
MSLPRVIERVSEEIVTLLQGDPFVGRRMHIVVRKRKGGHTEFCFTASGDIAEQGDVWYDYNCMEGRKSGVSSWLHQ